MTSSTLCSASLLLASSEIVFFRSNAPSSLFAVKLPRLISAVLLLFPSGVPFPTPSSSTSADILGGSTATKLARTLDVGLLLLLSLDNPLLGRPRASLGESSPPLVSKMERRLRTAEEDRSVDIAVSQCGPVSKPYFSLVCNLQVRRQPSAAPNRIKAGSRQRREKLASPGYEPSRLFA